MQLNLTDQVCGIPIKTMRKMTLLTLAASLTLLSGCGNFKAAKDYTDGSTLKVSKYSLFKDVELGSIIYETPEGAKFELNGVKSVVSPEAAMFAQGVSMGLSEAAKRAAVPAP